MDSSANDRLYFSTDSLPERDRFPAFCEEIVRQYTGLDVRTRDQSQFRAALELKRVGAIDIGDISTNQMDSARTADLIHDGDDSLLVVLLKNGIAYQTQCKTDQKLETGDAVVCDCAYPGELNVISDAQFWDLKVPRQRIAKLFPRSNRFAGAKLDKDPAARRLLFEYLGAARNINLTASRRVSALYGEHVADLIALCLGAEGDARKFAEERGARAARRAAVLREIDRRSGDAGLSAAAVAVRLGITPRYVHLLLEETGKSFTHHVLERRLDRAEALLRDPQLGTRKIADIAAEAGFTDLSYFNRAFRRHFGATPSDIRQASDGLSRRG